MALESPLKRSWGADDDEVFQGWHCVEKCLLFIENR